MLALVLIQVDLEFQTMNLYLKKLDKSEEVIRQISEMQEFFLQIWRKRLHYSQVSMDYLGKEPLSVFSPTFEFVPGFAYPFDGAGL